MQTKKIRVFVALFICVATSIIGACATTPASPKIVRYQCDRGTEFSVTLIEKGFTTMRGGRNSMPQYEVKNVAANILLLDGETKSVITLPVQKTGSGFMYSNGRYTLRGNGDEALWSLGKMPAEHCLVNP